MIGILSVGSGNIKSVYNAVDYLGFDFDVIESPSSMSQCSHIILPGVGSFHGVSQNLHRYGWHEAIGDFSAKGKPILGICLGMQLLATTGSEHGESKGLNLIPGVVEELVVPETLKLPHLGWNEVQWQADHPVVSGIKKHMDFYFVHRFHFQANNSENVLGQTEYGQAFHSAVVNKNVVGVQFHPEKSQDAGMHLLENFCEWDGSC